MNLVNYYLDLAERLCEYNTCLEKICGVVIVKDDRIISIGYTQYILSIYRNATHCINYLDRLGLNNREGGRIIHAEIAAICTSNRMNLVNASLYLVGKNVKENKIINNVEPCMRCMHAIIDNGIKEIICRVSEDKYRVIYL